MTGKFPTSRSNPSTERSTEVYKVTNYTTTTATAYTKVATTKVATANTKVATRDSKNTKGPHPDFRVDPRLRRDLHAGLHPTQFPTKRPLGGFS